MSCDSSSHSLVPQAPQPLEQALPRTAELLQQGIADGQHPGVQLYVSRNGSLIANAALGDARLPEVIDGQTHPAVPMQLDSVLLWLSTGKPITAVALGQLKDRTLLNFDDPIVTYIPEFAPHGKDVITIRQFLTHTAGFRPMTLDWPRLTWDEVIAALCNARMEPRWTPGEKAGYHTSSSWFILGEVVRRVSGKSFSNYVRDEIFLPLGMTDTWIGMPPEAFASYGDRFAHIYDMEQGERTPREWMSFPNATHCSPGGNTMGPTYQLGYFHEMLLGAGERNGVRILQPETVRELTSRQRKGMFDETFGKPIDWGLGFVINTRMPGLQTMPYGYGPYASPDTFGHSGYQSSTGFVDQAYGLVVAIVTNGLPGEPRNYKRFRQLDTALYEDLELNTPRDAR
ncbi:MAG: serine hydrolase domain-containing protein [Planctomycetales bacterium]